MSSPMPINIDPSMLQQGQTPAFGILSTPVPQKPQIFTQAPSDGGDDSGIGGLFGGLAKAFKGTFGDNQVSATNRALTSQVNNTPPQQIAQAVMGTGQSSPPPAMQNNPGPGIVSQLMSQQNPGQQQLPQGMTGNITGNTLSNLAQRSATNPMSQLGQPTGSQASNPIAANTIASTHSNDQYSVGNIANIAKQVFPNSSVLQQLATTQAAQESGLLGHPSKLATEANNLFGMKGTGTAGSVTMPTKEYINGKMQTVDAQFAAYKTPQDSMAAYAKTLQNPRYAGALQATNLQDAAAAMQKGGYATDPNYAKNLVELNNKMQSGVLTGAAKQVGNSINNPIVQMNSIKQAVQAAQSGDPMTVAKSYLGEGRQNHADVLNQFFSKSMGQNINIQTTPWCASFANSVLMSTGHGGTGSQAARSFLNYGTPTNTPTQGDIAVMSRGNDPTKGHVGFVDHVSDDGKSVYVLGGNESGQVMIKPYPTSRVIGYRVPPTAQELQQKAQNKQPMPQGAPVTLNDNGTLPPGFQPLPSRTPDGRPYVPNTGILS